MYFMTNNLLFMFYSKLFRCYCLTKTQIVEYISRLSFLKKIIYICKHLYYNNAKVKKEET